MPERPQDSLPTSFLEPGEMGFAEEAVREAMSITLAASPASGDAGAAGGPTFGRYLDPVEIGKGGMGRVFRALDPSLGRLVAIKVAHADHEVSTNLLVRFLREARITGQLAHPGIPPVHELGRGPSGEFYFAMKLIDGRPLSDILVQRPWREILPILVKVCETMAYAHSRGVVHRDLKPANVMVGEFGEVQVLDWGLARTRNAELGTRNSEEGNARRQTEVDERLTQEGQIMGTLAYMSPEQARGAVDEIDAASDVYSLGAILYEALTRRLPYEATKPNAYLATITQGRLAPPSERAPERQIPRELDAIVLSAMAREKGDRFPDATRLAGDLVAFLEGRPVSAMRYSWFGLFAKWIGRHRGIAAVAGIALAGLLVVAGLFLWRALDAARTERELRLEIEGRARRDADQIAVGALERRARELLPPYPDRIEAYRKWIGRAGDLLSRLDFHRAAGGGHELARDLETFRDRTLPQIERRLEEARRIERLFAQHREDWELATASIAERIKIVDYGGLVLAPIAGLVPIGRDPDTGLWEFAHLLSGEPPARRAEDGALVLESASAIVLVLVPGGEAWIGAANGAPGAPNADGQAAPEEGPVRRVAFQPFFVSKHEITGAQWARLTGESPRDLDGLLPARFVSWEAAREGLAASGLELPTGEEWEYAARARTMTPWWPHENPIMLTPNVANLLWSSEGGLRRWDEAAVRIGRDWTNAFALSDIHGNVAEWTLEGVEEDSYRVARGGSFRDDVWHARATSRNVLAPGVRRDDVGLRPILHLPSNP